MDSEITIIFAVGCYIAYLEYRLWDIKRTCKIMKETLDCIYQLGKKAVK